MPGAHADRGRRASLRSVACGDLAPVGCHPGPRPVRRGRAWGVAPTRWSWSGGGADREDLPMTVTQLHPAGPDADTGRPADPEPSADQSLVDGVTEPDGPAPEEPHLLPLVLADPATLLLTTNVRADARLDKPFVASVRDHGVLVPIVAHRTADGELSVLYGARRTLAAVEAGRAQVPVYVVDVPEEGKAREVFRLVRQLVENDHRDPLRDGERVAAYQQLSLLGLTATAIARRVHRRVGEVRSGLAVAGSEVAVAALDRFDLTLAHATVLAEFDGDADAVKTLTDTARTDPGRFEHVAQRLRDKRATDAARAAVAAELAAAGVRVVEEPQYGDRTVAKLDHLRAGGAMPRRTAAGRWRSRRTPAARGTPRTCGTGAPGRGPRMSPRCTCAPTGAGTGTSRGSPTAR